MYLSVKCTMLFYMLRGCVDFFLHLHSQLLLFQILNTPITMPDELFDVGIDNTSNVLDSVAKFSSVKEFMHADLFVGLHSTTVSYPHNFLEYMSS